MTAAMTPITLVPQLQDGSACPSSDCVAAAHSMAVLYATNGQSARIFHRRGVLTGHAAYLEDVDPEVVR